MHNSREGYVAKREKQHCKDYPLRLKGLLNNI